MFLIGVHQVKKAFNHTQNAHLDHPTHAQCHPGLSSLFTFFVLFNDCASGQ